MSDDQMTQYTKQQMLDQACEMVQDIQINGKQMRTAINMVKAEALEQLHFAQKERQMMDHESAAYRAELIQKMGIAAQNGNLAEMQRIKQLLDNHDGEL